MAVDVPMQCADGTTVVIEVDPTSESWRAELAGACEGHEGGLQDDGEQGGEGADPVSEPSGHWEFVGYVCDNLGICASHLLCADGTPQGEYIYVEPDGTRGETRTFCPGDADIPVATVTAPTPGQIFSAFKNVAPTKAVLVVQPPDGQTLVNFETVFSTVADPFTTPKIDLVPGSRSSSRSSPSPSPGSSATGHSARPIGRASRGPRVSRSPR